MGGIYTLWGIVGAIVEAALLTFLLRSAFPPVHRAALGVCMPLLAAALWLCGTDIVPAWAAAPARLLNAPSRRVRCGTAETASLPVMTGG